MPRTTRESDAHLQPVRRPVVITDQDDPSESGPAPIAGYTLQHGPPAMPALDTTVGAKQRYSVSVPNVSTRMLMGTRVQSTGPNTRGDGYDGFNVVTDGHVVMNAVHQSATMSAWDRVYIVSQTSSLAAIAKGDVLIGSELQTATLAGHKNVVIVGGYGPKTQSVSVWGSVPEGAGKPDFDDVVSAHAQAALISGGIVAVVSSALGIVGTKRALKVGSVVGYVLMTAGLISGFKQIAEGAAKGQLLAGFDADVGLPSGVGIHGKGHVTITTGLFAGISMFAHTGSITGIAGITAGLTAGIAASISGGLSASVNGLAVAGMQSIMSSSVVSVLEAELAARKGKSWVRGGMVQIGDPTPDTPQIPTLQVDTKALAIIKQQAGVLPTSPKIVLDGIAQNVGISAMKKVEIDVTPYTIEVTPLGIKIKYAGDPVVEITPLKISLKQLSSEVEVALDGVTLTSGPSTVKLNAASAKVSALKVLLG